MTDEAREFLSRYAEGTSAYKIAEDLESSEGTVRSWETKLDHGEPVMVTHDMRDKLRKAMRKLDDDSHRSERKRDNATDPLAADLERIYREFDKAGDRLRARENLEAIIRARAIEKEIEVADRRAKALYREARAANHRAEAQRLAERRALLICRKTTDGAGPGQDPKTTPPPEEVSESDS